MRRNRSGSHESKACSRVRKRHSVSRYLPCRYYWLWTGRFAQIFRYVSLTFIYWRLLVCKARILPPSFFLLALLLLFTHEVIYFDAFIFWFWNFFFITNLFFWLYKIVYNCCCLLLYITVALQTAFDEFRFFRLLSWNLWDCAFNQTALRLLGWIFLNIKFYVIHFYCFFICFRFNFFESCSRFLKRITQLCRFSRRLLFVY